MYCESLLHEVENAYFCVTGTLSNSFSAMKKLGPETMNPFLQDVLQFTPLLK